MAKSKPKTRAKSSAAKKSAAKKSAAKKSAASSALSARASKKPAVDLPGRIDGLRGWLDQIERRQSRMTYIGAAGLLIALAAAGAAIYLGVTNDQDGAKQADLDATNAQIEQVKKDTEAQTSQKIDELNKSIETLRQQVQAAQQQAAQAKQQAAQAPAQFTPAPSTGSGSSSPNNSSGGGNGGGTNGK